MIDDLITDDHDAQSLTMLSDRSVAAGFQLLDDLSDTTDEMKKLY